MTAVLDSPFAAALNRRDDLSDEDRRLLEMLTGTVRLYGPQEEIIAEDSTAAESCLLLEGFAVRVHLLPDGGRQITEINVAGDFVDLHGMLLSKLDHSVVALTRCRVAFYGHADLKAMLAVSPHLTRLFWLMTAIDAAIQRAWIVSMGRRTSEGRLAHFFCEVLCRLEAVGLASGSSFSFPVRQADLADMVGLSVVHVNRTLQRLRQMGLIVWDGATLTIPDPDGLRAAADFDPTYLDLVKRPR